MLMGFGCIITVGIAYRQMQVRTGKTTPDGRPLYTFKDNTGKQITAYKGKDERYYDPKVYHQRSLMLEQHWLKMD